MKSPDERGPLAAWAYDARVRLNLSPEAVVKELGRYNAATIRKAETADRHMSRPLWRALTDLYPRIAHGRGITIPIPPGHTGMSGRDNPSTPDVSALVIAIGAQTDAINRLIDRLDSLASDAIRDGVMDALREAGLDPGDGASPDELPPGSQR